VSAPGQPAVRNVVPLGLLGMLGLVVVIEGIVAGQARRFASDHAWCWRDAGVAAVRKGPGCDVLCFGDSLVKFGVLPPVVQSCAERKVYNLALHNGPPAASYFLLRRSTDAGAKPSAVVVDFLPHQLARDPRHGEFRRAWPELLSLRECVDLAWITRDAGFFASTMLAKLLPSYKARPEIRASTVALIEGRGWNASSVNRILQRNWQQNNGGQVLPAKTRSVAAHEWPDDAPLPRPWTRDSASVAYFERFLRLAANRGTSVFWLLPPITRGSPARREQLDPAYERFVRTMQDRFPNLVVIDGRRSVFTPSCYADPVHLHKQGAQALSASIAAVLAQPVPDSRWVELPDYREASMSVALEDLDQSWRAISARGTRRR
jgi:hypothetical protein